MFESTDKLARDAVDLLEVLCRIGGGRWACVVDRKRGVLLETPEPDFPLRAHLDEKREALFAIPAGMLDDDNALGDDVFEGWHQDDFFLAILNGRAAVVVACDDAEAIQHSGSRPLHALVDRLLRMEPTWRLDASGRGLFMGRPRLDIVIAGRSE